MHFRVLPRRPSSVFSEVPSTRVRARTKTDLRTQTSVRLRLGERTHGRGWDPYVKLQGETHSPLKLWKARSRLYRRRFLQPNTNFSAFFEIYRIRIPSHRWKLKIFMKIRDFFSEFLCVVIFDKICKIWLKFADFRVDFDGILSEFEFSRFFA